MNDQQVAELRNLGANFMAQDGRDELDDWIAKNYVTQDAPAPSEVPASAPNETALRDAVIEGFGGLHGCDRVWSAWNVGTMREDNFYSAAESDECIDQMLDALRPLLASASQPPATPAAPEVITADTAKAKMEEWLWNFIELAGNFPEVKTEERIWPHVLVYAPTTPETTEKAQLWDFFNARLLSRSGIVLRTKQECQDAVTQWADAHEVWCTYKTKMHEAEEIALRGITIQVANVSAAAVTQGELPGLPETTYNGCGDGSEPLYTPEMMQDYARAAIAAQQRADASDCRKYCQLEADQVDVNPSWVSGVRAALPVLKTMLEKIGCNEGAKIAQELIDDAALQAKDGAQDDFIGDRVRQYKDGAK